MLHYTTYHHKTAKQWVTFVHGAGGSSTIWFKQLREYVKHYNVLLLDLRGHGASKGKIKDAFDSKYTFENITKDVIEVLEHEKIEHSHFVGISLGTIIIRQIAEMRPNMVKSMIMGGAIMKMNFRSQILMKFGNAFKSIIPYLWLYKFFAIIIMPRRNHKESRLLFIKEARKLYQREFKRWFRLTAEINPLLKFFRNAELAIPTLYVMGEEDHMFLPTIRKIVNDHKSANLFVVPNCGHVVNVEQPDIFNTVTLKFLGTQA